MSGLEENCIRLIRESALPGFAGVTLWRYGKECLAARRLEWGLLDDGKG